MELTDFLILKKTSSTEDVTSHLQNEISKLTQYQFIHAVMLTHEALCEYITQASEKVQNNTLHIEMSNEREFYFEMEYKEKTKYHFFLQKFLNKFLTHEHIEKIYKHNNKDLQLTLNIQGINSFKEKILGQELSAALKHAQLDIQLPEKNKTISVKKI